MHMRRHAAARWLHQLGCKCDCRVIGDGRPLAVYERLLPTGLAGVARLCGLNGEALDISLDLESLRRGNHHMVIWGNATSRAKFHARRDPAQAVGHSGAHKAARGNGSFSVIVRMAIPIRWMKSKPPDVRCDPRNAACRLALREACSSLLASYTITLELQGTPGWPEVYGVGCCHYRYNSTHVTPVLMDARQPMYTQRIQPALKAYSKRSWTSFVDGPVDQPLSDCMEQ